MEALRDFSDFIDRHRRLFVLTGAGCSTGSGIPDYRDAAGAWKRKPPVTYQAFTGDEATRKRYWARSLIGWPVFRRAVPNQTHQALAALERDGRITRLVTQNVDRLHQQAGSQQVIDLHGRLDQVACLACRHRLTRQAFQVDLERLNPQWLATWQRADLTQAPDGDIDLEAADFSDFAVPDCRRCGGMLKPDVVFFGESVPLARVQEARAAVAEADAVLVVGSSLMVYSGYRFVLQAVERGLPVAAVNRGVTRADALLSLKVDAECASAFASLDAGRDRMLDQSVQ